MSEAKAEQNEAVEEPIQEDYEVVEAEDAAQDELLKFGILAVALLSTVLIIALLRPLIFGKIVPAVLGEGQPMAPLVNTEAEAEAIKPEATDVPVEEVDSTVEDAVEVEDTAVSPTMPTEAAPEPEKPEDFPVAVPAQPHIVQAGETLTAIARRYGVTVQAIVAANSIPNPDRVAAGTPLIIPQP